jgi:hypothetical protein
VDLRTASSLWGLANSNEMVSLGRAPHCSVYSLSRSLCNRFTHADSTGLMFFEARILASLRIADGSPTAKFFLSHYAVFWP